MIREILKMGDPRLLRIVEPVDHFDTLELHALVEDMFDAMRHTNGAGLAAPQIGVDLQVVIFGFAHNERYPDAEPVPERVLINPTSRRSRTTWRKAGKGVGAGLARFLTAIDTSRSIHFSNVWLVQPILGAMDSIAAHCDGYASRCSRTMRTARSRTSAENWFDLFAAPFSQESEPPPNSGGSRLPSLHRRTVGPGVGPEFDKSSRKFDLVNTKVTKLKTRGYLVLAAFRLATSFSFTFESFVNFFA